MTKKELLERERVVAEARKWIGTRYHHGAAVMGHGIDCAQLLLQSFSGAGLVKSFDPGSYPRDWHLHRDAERYLSVVESYAVEIGEGDTPLVDREPDFSLLPGDLLFWQVGRTFSHSAIVTEWPSIIHASLPAACVEEISVIRSILWKRKMKVYSYWGAK